MNAWLTHHVKALGAALRRLSAAPASTVLGALVIGIALALPAAGQLLLANVDELGRHVSATPLVSVFMAVDASKQDSAAVQARIRQTEGVRDFRYVPREQTLKRLREVEGLAEVIDSLPKNPFPDAFIVEPESEAPAELEKLRALLAELPKVEHAQLDSAWVKRLYALLKLGRIAVTLLAGLLGLALVVVTFNTIRLQILTQREEIEVSRLLGATDGFIRRPFFYFGALQGLLGGFVGWGIVFGAAQLLRQPVGELAGLYNLSFTLHELPLRDAGLLLSFAAALGWMGAWLSVTRHLRQGG